MRRPSLAAVVVVAFTVTACHSDRLTGPAARAAARQVQSSFSKIDPRVIWFLDGREVPADSARQIDPQRIQNVEVLKGFRVTELYGERAAYGVILVTTKTNKGA